MHATDHTQRKRKKEKEEKKGKRGKDAQKKRKKKGHKRRLSSLGIVFLDRYTDIILVLSTDPSHCLPWSYYISISTLVVNKEKGKLLSIIPIMTCWRAS